jgi:predicted O-methyltransferase YrrM
MIDSEIKLKREVIRVLKSLERMGEKEFVPSIGPVKGKILSKIIRKHKAKTALEIGTLAGYSAILIASLLPNDESRKKAVVTTIEIDKKTASIAMKNVQKAGFSDKIEIIIGDALEAIPKLDHKFDLLFLDAAKDEYLRYLKLAEQKNLHKNSIVVADNVGVSEQQMLDYLEYVRNSGFYMSKTIETELEYTPGVKDAIEMSIKKV